MSHILQKILARSHDSRTKQCFCLFGFFFRWTDMAFGVTTDTGVLG
jgi:hypothetical protein